MALDFADTFTMDPVYDIGPYKEPSSFVTDDFFRYDPSKTGGISWEDIYGNEEVLSGVGDDFGSNLLKDSLKFVSDYAKGSDDGRESQYYDRQKNLSGLPSDKSPFFKLSDSVFQSVTPSVYGGGGAGSMVLPAIQGGQSLYSMQQGMPQMGFKDVVGTGIRMAGQQLANKALYAINPVLGAVQQFYPGGAQQAFKDVGNVAGDVGNTVARFAGGAINKGIDFVKNLFCDERLKVDIAPLERTEVNDELAQMAFFVKGIRECS